MLSARGLAPVPSVPSPFFLRDLAERHRPAECLRAPDRPLPARPLRGARGRRGGGRPAPAILAQPKPLALLAFLALSPRGRFQRRDRLVGLLWPDLDQSH